MVTSVLKSTVESLKSEVDFYTLCTHNVSHGGFTPKSEPWNWLSGFPFSSPPVGEVWSPKSFLHSSPSHWREVWSLKSEFDFEHLRSAARVEPWSLKLSSSPLKLDLRFGVKSEVWSWVFNLKIVCSHLSHIFLKIQTWSLNPEVWSWSWILKRLILRKLSMFDVIINETY